MADAEVGGVVLEWGAATNARLVRMRNEDAVVAAAPVFAVADGMGGHRAGDVASVCAVDCLATLADESAGTISAVAVALRQANQLIYAHGAAGTGSPGMGTTIVGLVVVDNGGVPGLLVFNVGDSRAYCFAKGVLEQLSVDHSYVQELIADGRIGPLAARHHAQRNVVTRAVGVEPEVQADYWIRSPLPGGGPPSRAGRDGQRRDVGVDES